LTAVGRSEATRTGDITWVQVTSDTVSGWANARGLDFGDGDVASLPVTVPGPDQGVVTQFANVRVAPDRNLPRIARLDQGAVVTVSYLTENGAWAMGATADGTAGWMDLDALTFMAGAVSEETPVAADGTGIVLQFANPRSAPDRTAEAGERLNQGALVEVLASNSDESYYLIQAGEQTGWVIPRALTFIGGAPGDILMTNATVSVAQANFRAGASADSLRQGWGYAGDRVQVTGVNADGDWYRVTPLSRVGAWVSADLIDLDSGVGPFLVISAGAAEGAATEEAATEEAATEGGAVFTSQ
jgi:hypothetical protein